MSLIGKNVGNYQIKAKLGEGGMGTVYLGEHPLIGKRVAVKVLLEELAAKEDIVTRFFNEAKAVNDIGHQNIVDIVDFGKMKNDSGGDVVYFIMEFLDGESLAARLRRTGLAFNETMHVIAQCCSGLAASHAKGIVHRDLKPENIYLCPRGQDKNFIKILDFGIAKLTGDGGQSHKTRTGLVIGTPTYMSPEQCEGKGLIDHRSDVYSLGVVMYELLTGRVPFPGEGFGEILVAHLTKNPEPPSTLNPDITPEIEAIVMHSIEKDRNRRFQTMDEFAQAVADASAHYASYKALPGYAAPAGAVGSSGTSTGMTAARPITGFGPTTGVAQRPTTLSGAAAALEGDAVPQKSRMPMIYVAAAALAVAIGGGIVATNKKDPPKPVQPAAIVTQPPVSPKGDEKLVVTVTSDPPGAKVYRAGVELGATPLEVKIKKGDPEFDVQVKRDGFVSQVRSIQTDRSRELLVVLVKEASAVVPVANVTSGKKKGHSSSTDPAGATSHKKKNSGGEPTGDDMRLLQPNF